jgi:hypothetical protein
MAAVATIRFYYRDKYLLLPSQRQHRKETVAVVNSLSGSHLP